MDREVIEQKLESLRRCLGRIEAKCPASASELIENVDTQDILALNLTRAVQLCVDIGAHLIAESEMPPPATMGQTFDILNSMGIIDQQLSGRLKKSVGFRNLAVHNYEAIDWAIVHAIAHRHQQDFVEYARIVNQLTAKP